MQRNLLAILTAACGDIRHGVGESPLLDALYPDEGGGFDILRPSSISVDTRLPVNERQLKDLLKQVTEAAVEKLSHQASSAILYATTLFSFLAREASEQGFDVDDFLQRAALELESEQSG